MLCARCGHSTPGNPPRCSRCGADAPAGSIAADTLPIDTTGLPEGATFGASTGLGLGFGAETTVSPDGSPPVEPLRPAPTMGGSPAAPADATTGNPATTAAATTLADVRAPNEGPLRVGEGFGPRYHILRVLGVGGMGAVYQAWDAELGVAVALKVIRGAHRKVSPELEKRFKNELLLARQVTHKSVVRIHDLGEIEGIKYITMPYIEGDDLAAVLRREGKQTVAATLAIARDVAHGLRAAHDAGVVHRDLKPANVMIKAGAERHAVIMDFGISASADHGAEGGVIGTMEYMAPEQAEGASVDGRADIYAFGLILYELLTGPRARTDATPHARIEAMKRRFEEGLTPLRTVDPSISEPVDRIVSRCLEPNPDARYQTTHDLLVDLNRLDEAGELLPEPRRFTRRHAIAGMALLVAIVSGTYWLASTSAPPPEHAPVSVLVSDFENRTGDPVFQDSLEQALEIAVEAASFIDIYKRDTARKLAEQLDLGNQVDQNAARLISTREGINVVLAGAIEPRRSGYAVSVKAIDPATAKLLGTSTRTAGSKADVLKAIGSLASDVRTLLGDETSESAKLAATETVTTTSLEALGHYSRAQDLLYNSKDEQAIEYYKRAIAADPNLGRAFSGWAISAENLGRQQESAEAWKKALALVDRMTDREKYRTLGLYYVRPARNYEMAIDSFSTLVKLYPSDRGGHVNLALAYFYTRNFPKALEEGRRSVERAPRDLMNRTNYALYAMYAADFGTAAAEAKAVIEQDPAFYRAYLPLAMAALATSDLDSARKAYEAMAKSGAPGASVAKLGLADMALYQGRFHDAELLLRAGVVEDERQQNTVGLAAKYTALSEAYLGQGKKSLAVSAAERAIKLLGHDITAVPAARALIDAGKPEAARLLAAQLGEQLQPESRAYGKMLEGYLALREGRTVAASDSLLAAQKLVDLWWTRLDLGVAYAQAEHHAEALGELQRAQNRRGEATAILLDDLPTFRYVAPLVYWHARAQQGSGQHAAAMDNYKTYLAIRSNAPGDPLVADARRRVATR